MAIRSRIWLGALTYFVLVPIGVAVIITALLLFGVAPRYVFFPGHTVVSMLEALGVQVHNRIGVISTCVFWWAIIVSARLIIVRPKRGAA